MLLDDKWWEEFWKSEEGQSVKDAGRLEEAGGERILDLVQKRFRASSVPVPEHVLKAFEED